MTVDVTPDSSKNIGPMMAVAEIAADTVHLGERGGLVATLLGLGILQKGVFDFTFPSRWKWALSVVQGRLRHSEVFWSKFQ